MVESAVFEWCSKALEEATPWNSLAARGTIRLALKKAGLEPATVTKAEMVVVIERILERELEVRGRQDARAICQALRLRLLAEVFHDGGHQAARPEAIFGRVLGTRRPGEEP